MIVIYVKIGYILGMPNPNPTRLTDEQRGHRHKLSLTEDSKTYAVAMPMSLWIWCMKQGAKKIRDILTNNKEQSTKEQSNEH